MIGQAWVKERRLVPRWRSLRLTSQAGEMSSIRRIKPSLTTWSFSPDHTERLTRWRNAPNLISAAELIESAIVEGKEETAAEAARHIVLSEPTAAALVRRQARTLLQRTGDAGGLPEEPTQGDFHPIKFWRSRTRLHPHDALAWVELSLCHVIYGQTDHAERDMKVALTLAPDNRHVLRSASRLFLHLKQFGRAHDLFVRSPATRGDPWLMAAEISISSVAGRAPRFFKAGRALVEDGGLIPRLTTELAGALATQDMLDGGHKRSRKLFALSMMDPTGNALAQAEWATPLVGSSLVPNARFASVCEASEARAFHASAVEKYDEVVPACEIWAAEEPYSIRPYEFGSAVASLIGQYETALDLSGRGLEMRPGAPRLTNTHAFSLASLGRPEEAAKVLATTDWDGADPMLRHVAEANRGLIAFRMGRTDEGRVHYREAEAGFLKIGDRGAAASAKIYRAREERRAGQDEAPKAFEEAMTAWKKVADGRSHPALQLLTAEMKTDQPAEPQTRTWSLRAVISHGASTSPHRLPPEQQGENDEDRS